MTDLLAETLPDHTKQQVQLQLGCRCIGCCVLGLSCKLLGLMDCSVFHDATFVPRLACCLTIAHAMYLHVKHGWLSGHAERHALYYNLSRVVNLMNSMKTVDVLPFTVPAAASKSRRQSRFIGDSGPQADAFLASLAAAEIEGIYTGYPKGNSESGSRGQVLNIPQQYQQHLQPHNQRRSYCSSTASADDGGMPYASSSPLAHHTVLGGGGWPVNDPGNYGSGGPQGYGYASEAPLSAAMHPHNSINPSCRSSSSTSGHHQHASDSGHAAGLPPRLIVTGPESRSLRSPGGNEPSSLHHSPTQGSPYGSPRLDVSPMSRGGIGGFSGGDAGLDISTSQLSLPLSYEDLMHDPNYHLGVNQPRGRRTRTSMMNCECNAASVGCLKPSDYTA